MKTLNALSWAQYAYKVGSTYAEEDTIEPFPEHKEGANYNGEEASVSQTWEHNRVLTEDREYHLFNLDYSEYEEHLEEGPVDQELIDAFDEKGHEIADWADLEELDDDEWALVNENGGLFTLEKHEEKLKIYGEDIPLERAHTASTMMYFELPTDDLPDEATLEISAKNILGAADSQGEIMEAADGAEASVEIPIRNAEIESIESDNKDSYGDSVDVTNRDGSLYWDDEIGVSLNCPDEITTREPIDLPEVPKIDLIVDWGDGTEYPIKEAWEPYRWKEVDEDAGWSYDTYKTVDKEVSISHMYDLEDDLNMDRGDEKTVTIEITAEVLDQYGGWEKTIEFDLNIRYGENHSGTPAPPPGGPIPTGGDFPTFNSYSTQAIQFISMNEAAGLLEQDDDIWLLSHDERIYLVDETGDEAKYYFVG